MKEQGEITCNTKNKNRQSNWQLKFEFKAFCIKFAFECKGRDNCGRCIIEQNCTLINYRQSLQF